MKLPNSKYAYISREKLIHYLLSETHLVGKLKAKFFRRLGYDEMNYSELETSLIAIAKKENVLAITESLHGKKYIVDGTIATPNAKIVTLRTVWIIEHGKRYPRFITAYPV